MTAMDIINAALALPTTHEVVTVYSDGMEQRYGTRSLATAENFAIGQRRKIGRELIDRSTGKKARVMEFLIVELAL